MTQEQVKEAADKSWGQERLPSYNVGDAVEYLPHVCHAFTPDSNNCYPWVIGMKGPPRYERNPTTGEQEIVEDVTEIDEGRLHREVLPGVNRAANPKEERARLVPLRPKHPWPAVITQVYGDGSVDLQAQSNVGRGMVTLYYTKVPIDETGRTPHSWRKPQSKEVK